MTEFQPPHGSAEAVTEPDGATAEAVTEPDGATAEAVTEPDGATAHAARLHAERLAGPAGSLGMLAELGVWAAGVQGRWPPGEFQAARTVLFAADHGIAEAGVVPADTPSTARQAELVTAGRAPVNAVAGRVPIRLVEVAMAGAPRPAGALRRPSGRIDVEDALDPAELATALETGRTVADQEIEAGAELLLAGNLGVAASTPASALVAVLTDTEPIRVIGRSDGIDDPTWIRKCAAVRDARRRAWPHRADPYRLLAVAGGADLAALTGFLVQAASRRVPILLDGLVPCTAALLAQLACPPVVRWCLAGQQSGEPAHVLALRRLGLEPVLRLGVEVDQGVGALLALPVLRAATRLLAGTVNRTEPAAGDAPV